ncbi:GNAT family N-acetyltransferase [Undibacterium sp. Ji22W]|uniref:GNAT family N-acetyltransferase n=1 Tax=Undibacterium sp. Ji22W TaxID=3413038 RepID=UPI003BEFBC86
MPTIVENSQDYLSDFIRLNEEWISHYFEIEDTDRKLAADPFQIVDKGGYIFCLLHEHEVLGVCALFNNGEGVFELARMAVSPQHQGLGYSNLLIQHCLDTLQSIKAKKVYLVSNTKLAAAINLYKKFGFQTVSEGPHPVYSRANIVMEREV